MKTHSTSELSQVNQLQTPICFNYGTPNYVIEEYLLLMNLMGLVPEQANALYLRPINNQYAPTYNPNWKNHVNLLWSQRQHQWPPNSSVHSPAKNHFSRPNVGVYQHSKATNAGNNQPTPHVANSSYPLQGPYNDNDRWLTFLERNIENLLKTTSNLITHMQHILKASANFIQWTN